MSSSVLDAIYEEEAELWHNAIQLAVDKKEYGVAIAMAVIGPKVTSGKSKWTNEKRMNTINQIQKVEDLKLTKFKRLRADSGKDSQKERK